ncbi:MAG: 5'-nucleotidase C-terminal domain-containing protein [Deltaproteobacteria bacterium]|nr:5'-nucleotidase C-terminal domain-containing protein [Deltaproteobacteria bacterium]
MHLRPTRRPPVRPFVVNRSTALIASVVACALLVGCRTSKPPLSRINRNDRNNDVTRLLLLAINDLHGQLDPLELTTSEKPPRALAVGGAEALAATITELRSRHRGPTLLLDGGDFMQGTLLSNTFEGRPVAEFFRLLKVDAAAIGNHEFDFGPVGPAVIAKPGEDRRGALKALAALEAFPLLSANIEGGDDWPNIKKTLLIDRGKLRIGIIGLTTTDTPQTTFPDNVRDLRFLPLQPVVERQASALRARGAQAVVVVAHAGGLCSSRAAASCDGEIIDLARNLAPGTVDAIVAGHSHRCLWQQINGTPLVEACSRGVAIGRVELSFSPAGQIIDRRVLAPTPVCHAVFSDTGQCEPWQRPGAPQVALTPNPLIDRHRTFTSQISKLLAPYRASVAKKRGEVLAVLPRTLERGRDRIAAYGYFVAEVLRRSSGADVGLVNPGGLRADLPKGPITFGHVFQSFPFDNRLATVRLTTAQLLRILHNYAERPIGGVLQVAGLSVEVKCVGGRTTVGTVTSADGRPLDKSSYLVALSDFLLSGGDGLGAVLDQVPEEKKHIDQQGIRDLIVATLKNAQTVQQLLPLLPQRTKQPGCGQTRSNTRSEPLCR